MYCVWQVVKTPTIILNTPVFTPSRTIYILRQQFHTNLLPYHSFLSSFCHYSCCGLFNYLLLTLTQKRRFRNFSANSMTNIFSSKQAKLCYGAGYQIDTHASERNPGFCKHFAMIDFLRAATALEDSYYAVLWKCVVPSNVRLEIMTRKKNSNCTWIPRWAQAI